MDKRLSSKLVELQTCLEDAIQLLKEINAETGESPLPEKVQFTKEVDVLLNKSKQLSRDQAKKELESMKKKQIELLFCQLMGRGSSSEAKKPKEYVIDRILRRLFDVSREQDILLGG